MKATTIFLLLLSWVAFGSAQTTSTVGSTPGFSSDANTVTSVTGSTGMTTANVTELETTAGLNSTTTLQPTSTTTPEPTACTLATWTVYDNGSVCMKMSFGGTITYEYSENNETTVDIPKVATSRNSICTENSSIFVMSFPSDDDIWQLQLHFDIEGSKYHLDKVVFDLMTTEGDIIDTLNVTGKFFSVPLGEHYVCDRLSFDLGTAMIELSSPLFQPLVEHTTDGCGHAHECDDDDDDPNVGLIVGCCVAGVAAVVAGGFTIYLIKNRKKDSYDNI
ncbi:lysosome-associated membrane glycoprotein 2-like [Lytechinus variegatus]|uniref:lysosome-associated membrane glycoprotein 2-like n=1 Tax=Lytechinus variegatus TaxID=7654 RepID=UPI001BB0E993|nr:lysosome-associated membrane glycoprotein 2-like [Lytechinus variegatus]